MAYERIDWSPAKFVSVVCVGIVGLYFISGKKITKDALEVSIKLKNENLYFEPGELGDVLSSLVKKKFIKFNQKFIEILDINSLSCLGDSNIAAKILELDLEDWF